MDSNKTPEIKKISSEDTASSNNDNKTSGLAVAALVMAFFVPPVGLVLAIVALVQLKKNKESGKGIATAALVVSSLLILVFIMVWALFIGVLFSVDKAAKDSVGSTASKAEVTVKNNDTQSSEKGNAGLPEGFPSDFPIYPGGKISASSKTDGTYTVSFDTDDSKSKVEAYYSANLASNGWTSGEGTSSNDFGTSSTTTLKKDDSFVNVIVRESTQDTPTSASIIIYKKI